MLVDLSQATPSAARERDVSIDCLRGLVMILMALDHTRAFLSAARFAPLDLADTTPRALPQRTSISTSVCPGGTIAHPPLCSAYALRFADAEDKIPHNRKRPDPSVTVLATWMSQTGS